MHDLDRTERQGADGTVVAIGASAGGVIALQGLFGAIPPDLNLSFVVVQHFPPGETSRLPKLLEAWSSMPVVEAIDGQSPRPGCIHVAMPSDVLTLEQGVFHTRPVEGGSRRPGIDTIDALFESVAADRGRRAIAVVLSGTGMDGTAGAVCIHQGGGLVFVQEPLTALHPGMPTAVIKRGVAAEVLPVWQLAKRLCLCSSGAYERRSTTAGAGDITKTLDAILDLVRVQAGFDLSGYKPSPVLWRIQQRMETRRVEAFSDYELLLKDDPAELEALIRGIPIHVTEFFRDPEAWDDFSELVVEPLVRTCTPGPIRAWTPACSTGEEAYSLAMLLGEHEERVRWPVGFQVFATDASPEILARASRGIFSERAMRGVSPERRRFFYAADGSLRIKRSLREKMIFAPQDLLADPPLGRLDLVTCRNLLIYLDPDAAKQVLHLVHSSLRMGGFLFLGKSESIPPRQSGFEPISIRSHIYRKVGPMDDIEMKLPSRLESLRGSATLSATTQLAALEQFDRPSVLIDGDFRILRIYGDTGPVLRLPAGEPTNNLLDLAPRELVPHLQHVVNDALAGCRSVTVAGLPDRELGEDALGLRAIPLQTGDHGGSLRILVSFVRGSDPSAAGDSADSGPRLAGSASQAWSDAIRISHEELEASREELQAVNEELLASNELLNLSNENLNDSNAQLQNKIAELELQRRVLSSGVVMTLFIDEELRLRWFTPALAELFSLRVSDVGRLITDLAPRFTDRGFLDDVAAVIQRGEPVDAEIRFGDGRWHLRRIRPYRTGSGEISDTGVAITFTDIDDLKRAEHARRAAEAQQALLLQLSDVLQLLDDDRSIQAESSRLLREHLRATRVLFLEPAGGDELDADSELAGFAVVPIQRGGETVARLAAQGHETHSWSAAELILLKDVGDRTWTAVERARAEQSQRESEAWLSGQKEAFQAAVNGSTLEESLGILVRTAIEQMDETTRCGFYLADASGSELHHVAGMPESYSRCVDGFKIGPDSLACGLALYTRRPVITPDVSEEPSWKDWQWLADEFRFRACWSFPVETSVGKVVGSFAVYHQEPRAATPRDCEIAAVITRAAGIIISRHQEGEERARIARALSESEAQLRALVDASAKNGDAVLATRA